MTYWEHCKCLWNRLFKWINPYPSQLFLSIFWLSTSLDRWMVENLCIFSVRATLGAWPLSWASTPWHGALLCGHRRSALQHWAPACAAHGRIIPGDRTVISCENIRDVRLKKSNKTIASPGSGVPQQDAQHEHCMPCSHPWQGIGWQLWSANEVYGAGEQWGSCNSFRSWACYLFNVPSQALAAPLWLCDTSLKL